MALRDAGGEGFRLRLQRDAGGGAGFGEPRDQPVRLLAHRLRRAARAAFERLHEVGQPLRQVAGDRLVRLSDPRRRALGAVADGRKRAAAGEVERLDQLRDAAIEILRHRAVGLHDGLRRALAVALEGAGQRVDAPVQVARDRVVGFGDAGGGVLRALADGGDGAPRVVLERAEQGADATVEIARHGLVGFAHARGGEIDAFAQRRQRAAAAVVESFREPVEPRLQFAPDIFVDARDPGGRVVGARGERGDDALPAALQPFQKGVDARVEFLRGAFVGERDLRRRLAGALADGFDDALVLGLERREQSRDAGVEFGGDQRVRLRDRSGGLPGAVADRRHGRRLLLERRGQPRHEIAVARLEGAADALVRLRHFRDIALALRADALDRGLRRRFEPVDDVDAERVVLGLEPGAGVREPLGDGVGAERQGVGGVGGGLRERVDKVALAGFEVLRHRHVRRGDARDRDLGVQFHRDRGRGGRLGQPRQQRVGAGLERLRDVVVRFGDQRGGGLGALADLARGAVGGAGQRLQQPADAGVEFARDAVVGLDDAAGRQRAAGIERLQRRAARLLQCLDEFARALVEAARDLGVGLGDDGDGGAAAVLDASGGEFAVFGNLAHQGRAGFGELRCDGLAVAADGLGRLGAAGRDARGDIAARHRDRLARRQRGGLKLDHEADALGADRAGDGGGGFREAAAELLALAGDVVDQGLAPPAQRFVEPLGLADQIGGGGFRRHADQSREFAAGSAEPRGAVGAGAFEDAGDLRGGAAERSAGLVADLADPANHAVADGIQMLRGLFLRARQRAAQRGAVDVDALAVVREFGDQRPQPPLMFAGGALQRRNLAAHQRFQLAGAGEGALDAVAHRGHFAADRLAQRGELLARHALGFGQPHRDMGDGGGRLAQLRQPARQSRKAEHHHHRRQRGEQEQHGFRAEHLRRGREVVGRALVAVIGAKAEPKRRQNRCGDERGGAGAADLQRLDDGAGGGAVVVGGPFRGGEARLRGRRAGLRRRRARLLSVSRLASGCGFSGEGGFRTGAGAAGPCASAAGFSPAGAAGAGSSLPRPRLSASSIASMAWDTGSEALSFFAIASAFIPIPSRRDCPVRPAASPGVALASRDPCPERASLSPRPDSEPVNQVHSTRGGAPMKPEAGSDFKTSLTL